MSEHMARSLDYDPDYDNSMDAKIHQYDDDKFTGYFGWSDLGTMRTLKSAKEVIEQTMEKVSRYPRVWHLLNGELALIREAGEDEKWQ